MHGGFLGFPDFIEIGVFALDFADVGIELFPALPRRLVAILLQRLAFDFQLDQAPLQLVHLLGFGVDFHADHARGLVDQIDGLVGKLPIGDIALRQARAGDDGGIGDFHAMVNFVALLEAAQNRDGVFLVGLLDQHFLEPALKGGVFFDALRVFVERGGANAVQLAPGEGGLEHVAGIHRAFSLAGADEGVEFVDEEDDRALAFGDFLEHTFHALLEFAAVLGSGDERAEIEGEDALVLESFGHLPVDDALGEALGDGGLAYSRLADQHGVVLGAALQHLYRPADFAVAADHRVKLALAGAFGEIGAELFERPPALFGLRIADVLATAHLGDGSGQGGLVDTGIAEQLAGRPGVLQGGEQRGFAGDEAVALPVGDGFGPVQQFGEFGRNRKLAVVLPHPRQIVDDARQPGLQLVVLAAGLGEQGGHRIALLPEHGQQQVGRGDAVVARPQGKRLGVSQRRLEFAGQFVRPHGSRCLFGFPVKLVYAVWKDLIQDRALAKRAGGLPGSIRQVFRGDALVAEAEAAAVVDAGFEDDVHAVAAGVEEAVELVQLFGVELALELPAGAVEGGELAVVGGSHAAVGADEGAVVGCFGVEFVEHGSQGEFARFASERGAHAGEGFAVDQAGGVAAQEVAVLLQFGELATA